MVTKTDIISGKPTLNSLSAVAEGDTVSAAIENRNNQTLMNPIIRLHNWIIDSGIELSTAQTFSAQQTFSAGIKIGQIDPLTANGNIIASTGTGYFRFDTSGEVYKGSVVAGNALQTLTEVQTEISTTLGAGIDLILAATQTANFNAVVGTLYPIDTSGGAFTGTLPATATTGDIIGFYDEVGSTVTNNFTIGYNGNDIQDLAEDMDCNANYFAAYLIYDTVKGWHLI